MFFLHGTEADEMFPDTGYLLGFLFAKCKKN